MQGKGPLGRPVRRVLDGVLGQVAGLFEPVIELGDGALHRADIGELLLGPAEAIADVGEMLAEAMRLAVAVQAHGLGEPVVELGDAAFEFGYLRQVAAGVLGPVDAGGDVGEAAIHLGQRPHVGALGDPRRKLFDRHPQGVDIALRGEAGALVVDALVETGDFAAQALHILAIGRRRAERRLGFLEHLKNARLDVTELAAGGGNSTGLGPGRQILRGRPHMLDALGKLGRLLAELIRQSPLGLLFGALETAGDLIDARFEAHQGGSRLGDIAACGTPGPVRHRRQPFLHRLETVAGSLLAHFDVVDDIADRRFEGGVAGDILGLVDRLGLAGLGDLPAKNRQAVVDGGEGLDGLTLVVLEAIEHPVEGGVIAALAVGREIGIGGRVLVAAGKFGELLGDGLEGGDGFGAGRLARHRRVGRKFAFGTGLRGAAMGLAAVGLIENH